MKIRDLFEAYDFEGAEKYTGIDRDIYNWVRNEQYLGWSASEIEEARSKYGNVPVGTVYRGLKINNRDLLERLEKIKSNGGTLPLNLESASHNYSEAMSFALYVKSYDEMSMMWELKDAIERGSAGLFGSALVSLRPSPEQVIVKTYKDGDETKVNPQWRKPPYSLEQEIILKGEIPVVAVEIFYPLTKETWRETLTTQITTLDALTNDFIHRWLDRKVSKPDLDAFGRDLLPSLVKSDDDVAKLFKVGTPFSYDVVWELPLVHKFVEKYIDKDSGNLIYKGERIHVPLKQLRAYSHRATGMEAKFKSLISQWTPEPLVSNHHHFWVMTHSAILNDIAAMVRIKPALLDKFKNHPTLRAINNQIIEAVKDVVDTTENKFTDDRIAEDFLQQIEVTVQMLKYLHPLLFDARRVIVAMVQYLVQRLATPGKITKQKERAMWIQQKSVERCLGQLMALKD